MIALQSLPPELVAALLEQGGPTAALGAVLWWRLNKLEERFSNRLDRLDDDVSANSGLIYDRLLGQQYPKPDDADHVDAATPPARQSTD